MILLDRSYLSNTILSILIILTTYALWSLGESRVDAYIALYILEYVVVKAVLRPRRRGFDWLMLILLIIFTIIIGYRIAEVLY